MSMEDGQSALPQSTTPSSPCHSCDNACRACQRCTLPSSVMRDFFMTYNHDMSLLNCSGWTKIEEESDDDSTREL